MVAEHVTVNEVGPRDGLQSQTRTLDGDGRLAMIRALVEAGLHSIEAGSFVSPKAVPQMAGTGELFARLPGRDEVRYSALVPNARGYELARGAGVGTVSVVLSATETMNRRNINMGLDETTAACAELMARAAADGIEGWAYLAVAYECPFEGPTPPAQVERLAARMLGAGARKLIIADTIGAANPAQVRHLIGNLVRADGARHVACHFHDTRGMALANVLAALEEGVRDFDSSIGGLGGCPFSPGASGNVATEDVVLMLESMGLRTGIDLDALVAAVERVSELLESPLGGHAFRWLRRRAGQAKGGAHV
ncbi:hydroxymethylglutaryl-CoA lyase [Rhodanobacter thiooxydans]|uniref:Hydroxymethylglutaryl-CoA lyase n=2 Tax=Rhodanobacter thiooxydans TaxID=416169 RepID=A0A154QEP1_9GAMM|nr:hydroxymethylglutaryl-CoA lyase [Rhodanobacter thiooxydans]EIL99323.1 hydroxymethylglutaryl-CoA lyase [Rhodanobacter thiooxydans LCS2]KZC22761.1 hydroxymethylglutaryl-CoA lyase [Rhodanobacter thiooxydans]MCW0202144.1 hydroxymethylglutaryl-CoA lyase [Rhodanobacter thiooxydans]